MSTDVTSLDNLDPVTVATREQYLIQLLTEKYPTLDFTVGGVLQQLIAQPNAVLDVLNRTEIQMLKDSMSLATIQANPAVADDATVDALLSNYMVPRASSTQATGVLAIVISNLITTSLPSTTAFTVNGRTFYPIFDYIGVPSAAMVTGDSTKIITSRSDGTYWFQINVIENVSEGPSVIQGAQFTPNPSPDGFVQAYAAIDFSAGSPPEDNAALVAKMANGVSVKAVADRQSTTALLKEQFPGLIDVSIIGYGDMEMSRDRGNIFGIGCGGKADVYVRTTVFPAILKQLAAFQVNYVPVLPQTDPLVEPPISVTPLFEADMPIPVDQDPHRGYYRVEKITPVDLTSQTAARYQFTSVAYGGNFYPPGQEFTPLINNADQARFTIYQPSTVHIFQTYETQQQHVDHFISQYGNGDNVVLLWNGYGPWSTANYTSAFIVERMGGTTPVWSSSPFRVFDVYTSYIPGLLEIQTFLNQRQQRSPGADYLVKAANPCFVGATVTVGYVAGTQAPDVPTLQSAIALAINNVPFSVSSLQSVVVVQAVADVLGKSGYVLLPMSFSGQLLLPDGTTMNLSGTDELAIPTLPEQHVSRRTTAYFASPENINITLKSVSAWSV